MRNRKTQLVAIAAALCGPLLGLHAADSDSEETLPPVAIYKVSPKHPEELYNQAIEGSALVSVTVDIFGSAMDPQVEKATHKAFG